MSINRSGEALKYPGPWHGEDVPNHKLTDEAVREARQLYAQGFGCRRLALHFGVSRPTIQKAVKGLTWKHVRDQSHA